ncbi:hypothetical protein OUG_0658 [Helicobacter pylori R32b]|nr:hypothetical protein OUG_0658 [Helicobacter pylori R32b]
MLFIVSVNSLLSLKKSLFFNILLGLKKLSYPFACDEQAFKDKLVF